MHGNTIAFTKYFRSAVAAQSNMGIDFKAGIWRSKKILPLQFH